MGSGVHVSEPMPLRVFSTANTYTQFVEIVHYAGSNAWPLCMENKGNSVNNSEIQTNTFLEERSMLVWQLAKEISGNGITINGEPLESKHLVEALDAAGFEGMKVQSKLEEEQIELLRETFKESIEEEPNSAPSEEPIPSPEVVEAEIRRNPAALRAVKCRDGRTYNLPYAVSVEVQKWARAGAHTSMPIAIYEQRDGWTVVRDDAQKRKFKPF